MVLVAFVLVAVLLAGPADQAVSGAVPGTPILRPTRLTAAQMVDWFEDRAPGGYRATVPVEEVVAELLDEGTAQGVAGDVAFAQSVLETGWFRFDTGQVRPEDNNFGGLGATGTPGDVARFPTAEIGLRAQVQHLWAYADPEATASGTARPLVDPRFDLVVPKGKAPTWEQLGSGAWATDPDYGAKVLALYADMLDSAHVRVQRFVGAAFTDVLHRPPDPGGLAWWTSATEAHGRPWAAAALCASPEAVGAWILDRYRQVLHRDPTAAALAHRVAEVRAGGSLEGQIVALAASDEAVARSGGTDATWVAATYAALLGRPVDGGALDHWVTQLGSGATDRARVVQGVWRSAESRRYRVAGLFDRLLDRAPGSDSGAWWADRLLGRDDLRVTAEVAASREYFLLAQV